MKRRARRKIKWGVAGCGRFSEQAFIPNIPLSRKGELTSLFSNTLSRAKQIADKFGVSNYYNNYDEFLNSDIDAVYIGSANAHHFEQVIKGAKAGKHILCEKPLSITSSQAEEMVNVCRENNVQLAVNFVQRFHPFVVKAKEMIDNQVLGKLVTVSMNFNIDYPPSNNFRYSKELSGGGALRDLGTHLIDLIRFFGGEISDINGIVDNIIYKGEVDDFASAVLRFKKSGYGYFTCSFNSKKAFNRIEIIGHKGAISIENLIAARNVPARLTILLDGEARKTFRKRSNKLLQLIKSVSNSFLKNEAPLVTGYDGLVNMKLMEELERKCLSDKS